MVKLEMSLDILISSSDDASERQRWHFSFLLLFACRADHRFHAHFGVHNDSFWLAWWHS
jgi:hypothetical protein